MNEDVIEYDDVVEDNKKKIDWIKLAKKVWANRKRLYVSLPIAFVVSSFIALCIPNYYKVEVKLAPELSTGNSGAGAGLSSLIRSMGIGGLSQQNGGDAILPNLYPDLMNSKAFYVSLFDVHVDNHSKKTPISTTYYDYLENYQKLPWWTVALKSLFESIAEVLPTLDDEEEIDPNKPADAYALTKDQTEILKYIEKRIVCDVDLKTFVITIDVTDTDPVICAEMADSTCRRLQDFITEYRTKKARQEMENIQKQYDKAKQEYEAAKDRVAAFNDANWDLVEEDFLLEKQSLHNEMQLKYSAYSAFNSQLISARAKLEELRPVYTVLDGASIPLKKDKEGPKRSRMVIMLVFLVFMIHSAWIVRDDIKEMMLKNNDDDDEN